MKVFESVKELRAELDKAEQSGIGFVPTMGALHAGHRSLVERARRENGTVVVSVFVNPTQFNDKNDLKHYPRTPEADARLLEEHDTTVQELLRQRNHEAGAEQFKHNPAGKKRLIRALKARGRLNERRHGNHVVDSHAKRCSCKQ